MEWFGHLVLIERSNSSYRVVLFEYCLRKSQIDKDTKGSMRHSRGKTHLKTQWMSGCLYVKATAWSNCRTVTSSKKYIRWHLSKYILLARIIFVKEQLLWYVYFYIQDNHSLQIWFIPWVRPRLHRPPQLLVSGEQQEDHRKNRRRTQHCQQRYSSSLIRANLTSPLTPYSSHERN